MAKPLPCPRPPALGLRQRPPLAPQDPEITRGEPSPPSLLSPPPGLRPLSPTFVRKVDGLQARTPPRVMRRSWRPKFLLGCNVGGQGSGGRRACLQIAKGLPFLPGGRRRSPGRGRPGGPPRSGRSRAETRPAPRENGALGGRKRQRAGTPVLPESAPATPPRRQGGKGDKQKGGTGAMRGRRNVCGRAMSPRSPSRADPQVPLGDCVSAT